MGARDGKGGNARKPPETVVISFGAGGRMDAHYQLYTDYRRTKTKVEVRGPCYSACTLVLAYVEDICIAEGAFMAFHAVRSKETGARMDWETGLAYRSMPSAIRTLIVDNAEARQAAGRLVTGRCAIASCWSWAMRVAYNGRKASLT